MPVRGGRRAPRTSSHLSPRYLVGARRITHDITDVTKKKQLTEEWEHGELKHDFLRSDYSVQYQSMGFAMKVGGGFDAVFARSFAWRVLRSKPHPTHLTVDGAVEVAQAIGAGRSYLTHQTHEKRHVDRSRDLPAGIEVAYDGMKIDFELARS